MHLHLGGRVLSRLMRFYNFIICSILYLSSTSASALAFIGTVLEASLGVGGDDAELAGAVVAAVAAVARRRRGVVVRASGRGRGVVAGTQEGISLGSLAADRTVNRQNAL